LKSGHVALKSRFSRVVSSGKFSSRPLKLQLVFVTQFGLQGILWRKR